MVFLEKLIFACPSNGNEPEVPIMLASIRKFGGEFANNPIWVLTSKPIEQFPAKMKEKLDSLDVEIIPFEADPKDLQFPFVMDAIAASKAEELAKEKAEILAWMDINTLIIKEPKHFILDENINFGYRPVHHTLIGSIYDKPLDSFWVKVYKKCEVPEEKVFPMNTHVDGNTLRPYINSGFLIVRPKRGILNEWRECYLKLYNDPDFEEFYTKDNLYTIFIHQAVLSAVVIRYLEKEEMKELPFSYNYPIHLYPESSREYQPDNISDLRTARFYLDKLQRAKWRQQIPIREPLKSWLINQLDVIGEQIDLKKVKLGQVPYVYPIPIVLIGALVDGKPNFEELGDVAVMGINPAIVCISSGNDHHTNKGILEHNTFSINFPTTKMLALTDYCGTVSGKDVDKSNLFDVFYGDYENTPMITECPVNLECRVIKEFSVQHRQIFIAEVVQAYINEEFVTEENDRKIVADLTKLDPIMYALDNRYYKIGEPIGIGYKESKKLKEEE